MNTGAFGENFPYSNFHDMNMDWVIKIAKDFLDQYTHLQETINTGLTDLENKANDLEALLQAWYDTHSEDIANQLAKALNDLNAWYDEHKNYLDQTFTENIALFNQRAEAKAAETIATIPSDYTALSNRVTSLQNTVTAQNLFKASEGTANSYVKYDSGNTPSLSGCIASAFIPVFNTQKVLLIDYITQYASPDVRGLAFYDSNKEYLSGFQYDGQNTPIMLSVPANAYYIRITTDTTHAGSLCKLVAFSDPTMIEGLISAMADTYGNAFNSAHAIQNLIINYTNGNSNSFNGGRVSQPITVKPKTPFLLKDYITPYNRPDNRGMAFYDLTDTYVSGIQYDGTGNNILGVVPDNAAFVRITSDTNRYESCKLILFDEHEHVNILPAFNHITCIGDSLTYSLVYTSANTNRQAYNPYPAVIEKLTGTPTENISHSGANCIYIWQNFFNDLVSRPNQLFIIYLATNDGLTDTMTTDAPYGTEYMTWANTNTGCYTKLARHCLGLGKVVLVLPWANSGQAGVSDLEITQRVIRQVGARFNIPVVDPINLADNKYHMYPDLSGRNVVHMNDLGYTAFAEVLMEKISSMSDMNLRRLIPN